MDTSFLNDLNWIAILCAALGYFMLGAIWYSKILFSKTWLLHTKIDPKDPNATKGMGFIMLMSFAWMFITAVGIAIIASRMDLFCWKSGIKLGLATGLFFGVSAISISYLYEKRPLALYLINGGYTLFGNIIAALVICSWP